MIIRTLQIVAAVGTIVTGLISLIRPRAVQGFTGLKAEGGRGITEIRAVLGGFFVALGAVPLILNATTAYQMLGIAYLVVGAIRAISMFVDRSVMQSNITSLIVEIIFGIILVLNPYGETAGGPEGALEVPLLLIYRQTFEYQKMGYGAALSMILFVIILLVTLIQGKFGRLGRGVT